MFCVTIEAYNTLFCVTINFYCNTLTNMLKKVIQYPYCVVVSRLSGQHHDRLVCWAGVLEYQQEQQEGIIYETL